MAREFTSRWASPETLGGGATLVGPAVVNDAAGRSRHDLDVVALGREADGGTRVLALGEAKHTTTRRTVGDLDRLDRIRDLVAGKDASALHARLLLFSAAGFDRALQATAAERSDVELVDLPRIFSGD